MFGTGGLRGVMGAGTNRRGQSVLFGDRADRDVAIVYSPLNGAGLGSVTRVLAESGFSNVTVVEEQRVPDGNFPTYPRPNPEEREAMGLGVAYASRLNADLVLATDPDCDRCGVAVKLPSGGYRLLTGNEVGLLLLDFICAQRARHRRMPKRPVFTQLPPAKAGGLQRSKDRILRLKVAHVGVPHRTDVCGMPDCPV